MKGLKCKRLDLFAKDFCISLGWCPYMDTTQGFFNCINALVYNYSQVPCLAYSKSGWYAYVGWVKRSGLNSFLYREVVSKDRGSSIDICFS